MKLNSLKSVRNSVYWNLYRNANLAPTLAWAPYAVMISFTLNMIRDATHETHIKKI
jgi:hypothetical protein